jgi:DNA-binding transcriptional LysR family regulator
MDPRFLRTFVTVAELGSFSAAAQQLGYTQSGVSQHVAALESALGTALLHRRPVRPTAAGARLLEHAHPILLRLDAARADIERLTADAPARLVVGATPLVELARLATALERLRRATPRLEVTLRVATRAAIAVDVATGALDAGLVDGIAAPSDPLRLPDGVRLRATAVAEDPLVVAVPAGHPLAGGAVVGLDALGAARWLDAPGVLTPLEELRAATGVEGFAAALRCEGTDLGAVLALVAAGHGLALVPARVVEGVAGVAGVPLGRPRLVHRTELVHAGGAAADALAAALQGANVYPRSRAAQGSDARGDLPCHAHGNLPRQLRSPPSRG